MSKYLVRPDDFVVWSLNEDGETYSIHAFKKEYPNNLHFGSSYDICIRCGFFSIEEDLVEVYNQKHKQWCAKMIEWVASNHCGCGEDDD